MPPPAPRERPSKKKKKREALIRAACTQCRKRKLSCDGARPTCTRCATSGTPELCAYPTLSAEETRTSALHREVASLRATLSTIASSFSALRELPPEASARMLGEVAGAPNPVMELIDVGRRVEGQRRLLEGRISAIETARACFPSVRSSLEFELNILHPMAYPTFAAMMRSDRLRMWADIPTHAIGSVLPDMLPVTLPGFGDGPLRFLRIGFWTKVPIGDELAARAISVYLKTDHALLGHLDSELFLGDLLACRTRFCSPLLVNALLYYCCVKLTAFERDALVLVDLFRRECEIMLQSESEPHMLVMSALAFVFAGSIHGGRIAEATVYMARAVKMGEELQVWGSTDVPSRQTWSAEECRMLSFAAWGVFVHTVFWAFRWWDRLPPPQPNLAVPLSGGYEATRSTKLFGLSSVDAVRSEETFAALCNVLLVIRDAVVEFHGIMSSRTRRFSLHFAQSIYRRLLQCNDNDTMLLEPNTDAPDFVTIIRMWFHMAVMDLFQPFLQQEDTLQGFSASHSTARSLFLVSLRQLQHLVLLYRFRCPLAMTTPLWHGCIFFVAKAVAVINISAESETTFRLCVLMYADLVVAFPGLLDIFRTMMLMGLQAGFMTVEESNFLVNMITHKRDTRHPSAGIDLRSLTNLSLDERWVEAARPEVDASKVGP